MTRHVPKRPETPPGRAAGIDPATSRWLDGEASPEEARLVEARLAADPRLAAEVERLRADLDRFRADVRPRPNDALADRVLAAVRAGAADPERNDEERFRAVARRWTAAAAVLAAVGVGGSLAVDQLAPAAAADDSLVSAAERTRFDLEVILDLDRRAVAPTTAAPDAVAPDAGAPMDPRSR